MEPPPPDFADEKIASRRQKDFFQAGVGLPVRANDLLPQKDLHFWAGMPKSASHIKYKPSSAKRLLRAQTMHGNRPNGFRDFLVAFWPRYRMCKDKRRARSPRAFGKTVTKALFYLKFTNFYTSNGLTADYKKRRRCKTTMSTMPTISSFLTLLQKSHLPSVFNPWADYDPDLDISPEAPTIRSNQLAQYLKLRLSSTKYIFIAEAVGYQGGRFSGIPLTSERILLGHHPKVRPEDVIGQKGVRSSNPACLRLNAAERGQGMAEPTATVVWGTLLERGVAPDSFVFWNIFPFHPFKPKSPQGLLTNRTPTPLELEHGAEIFRQFHRLFPAAKLFAIGVHADKTLQKLGIDASHLPHPANGHVNQFRKAVGERDI